MKEKFSTGSVWNIATYIEWYKRSMQASEKYKWSDVTGEGEGKLERQSRTIESIRNEVKRVLDFYWQDMLHEIADKWTSLIIHENIEKIVVAVSSALWINLLLFWGTNIQTLVFYSIITYLINLKLKFHPTSWPKRKQYEDKIEKIETEKTLKLRWKELIITWAVYDILSKQRSNSWKSQ